MGPRGAQGRIPSLGVMQAAALVCSPHLVGGAAGPAPVLLYLFLIWGEAGRNGRLCSASSPRGGKIPAASPPSLGPHPGCTWSVLRTWQELAGAGSGTRGPAVRTHCSAWPSCPGPSPGAPCPGSSSRAWGWVSQKRIPPPPSLSPKMRSRWDTRSPRCRPLPGGCVGEGSCPLATVGSHSLLLFGGQGPPKEGGSRLQARWAALGWAGGPRVPAPLGAPWQHRCSSPVWLLRHPRGS